MLEEKIFENFVVCEILKSWHHNGKEAEFFFYRDKNGAEIDLLMSADGKLYPIEIKSKTMPNASDIKFLRRAEEWLPNCAKEKTVISLTTEKYYLAKDVLVQSLWDI